MVQIRGGIVQEPDSSEDETENGLSNETEPSDNREKTENKPEGLTSNPLETPVDQPGYPAANENGAKKNPAANENGATNGTAQPLTNSKPEKKRLREVGKLYSQDRMEWIKYCPMEGTANEFNLPYSAMFCDGMYTMKLHRVSCLMTSSNKYIARVEINRMDEIDQATTFEHAIAILKENLRTVKVFLDLDFENAEKAKECFEKCLTEISTNCFENVQNAGDLFQIALILNQNKSKIPPMDRIKHNVNISAHTRKAIEQYVEVIIHLGKRGRVWNFFSKLNSLFTSSKESWIELVEQAVIKGNTTLKQKSLELCPPLMKRMLEDIPEYNVFFLTAVDIKLFSDMVNALDEKKIKTILPVLVSNYCEAIKKIPLTETTQIKAITNPIFYYVCKSLTDVLNDINARTKEDIDVYYIQDAWKCDDEILWAVSPKTLLDKCLERILEMILRMMNHFEPGKPSALQQFQYNFKIFTKGDPNIASNCLQDIPTQINVWLCLLDYTIDHVFSRDNQIDQLCSCLLEIYKSCSHSQSSTMDSMESLRVITHNTIKFLALAAPFFNSTYKEDREILLNQIKSISQATVGDQISFTNYRDLVEVFAQFWKQRDEFANMIAAKLSQVYFRDRINNIQKILLGCMKEALMKNVELDLLISFCRAYEELLVDLLDLSLEWYVRTDNGDAFTMIMKKGLVELVQNKWQDSEHKCYRVTNIDKFSGIYVGISDDGELPKHYVLETIKTHLRCIYNMLMKDSWKDGQKLSQAEQISSATLMIASVRSCLVYLDEQPGYIDFEKFLEENSKPFVNLSNKCTSFEDFKKRVLTIKESFWYIRNLNAIDFDTAMNLFKLENHSNYNEEYLRSAYNKYNEQFEIYMGMNDEMAAEEKIKVIVAEAKSIVVEMLTPEWTFEFKQNALPQLLAGMGAVWALHSSKDVASTGQYLKPHCIQVLGVLRLLSADNVNQGVMKHLAQILTGQGKSLVLGMTACALALYGHSVTIMCYSEYLATRDQLDFNDFYEFFSVGSKIEYKTFGDAASEEFNRYSSNAEAYINEKCLGIPLESTQSLAAIPKNPILLVDEVDVFFTENFYGKSIILGSIATITGLDEIQLEIWRLVTSGASNIRQAIDTFIGNKNSKAVSDFSSIMSQPSLYTLLESREKALVEKKYNNTTLFSDNINEMIKIAEKVYNMKDDSKLLSNFRINEDGIICYKDSLGIYTDSFFYGYYNTFMYFRLKKEDFVPGKNFGYLVLDMGNVSYAKLPESFPLILGVTGTLTTLSHYEKKVVTEYYQINDSSVMPSFFGTSILQFDKSKDVNCFKTTLDWMNNIFNRINVMVNNKRSVLVFFETEEAINTFKQQFGAQLDRLNILTVNTKLEEKERLIAESGVSKTITLATREMGRGVDYKSSVTVEKNGGVHVIQTFFSLDIKEETQIKGRTARKDNRGSYEMILCYEDLSQLNLEIGSFESQITYQKLSDARDAQNKKHDAVRDANLQIANEKHEKTIDFYKNI